MKVLPIASSSKGNACLVEHDGAAVLIDCGVSCSRICSAFARMGVEKGEIGARLRGVLITHDHWDHICGLDVLLRRFNVPVYANAMTSEATAVQRGVDDGAFVCFENGQTFEIGPFAVSPFSIPHDAADPVGYLVRAGGTAYFHGTDIGTPLDSVGLKLAEADIATLESNHDSVMLWQSARPPSLKQRISGPRGHLSNDDAAALVKRFASPRLKRLYLAHLSHECNAPHLAEGALREAFAEMGRTDIALSIIR